MVSSPRKRSVIKRHFDSTGPFRFSGIYCVILIAVTLTLLEWPGFLTLPVGALVPFSQISTTWGTSRPCRVNQAKARRDFCNDEATRYCCRSRISLLRLQESILSNGQGEQSKLATTAEFLPLNKIFNSERTYLFTTQRNIRSFEWGEEELEDLWEVLTGLCVKDPTQLVPESGSTEDEIADLGVIMLVERKLSPKIQDEIGDDSETYDVHDGQQRLVTLSILLAALCDNMIQAVPPLRDEAIDVAATICNVKPRLKTVFRISIRDGASTLETLLNVTNVYNSSNYKRKLKILPKKERARMKRTDSLLLDAYTFFHARIKEMMQEKGSDVAWDLYKALKNRVFIMVNKSPSAKLARKFVLGLGKGKNLELVDEFKSLVCFDCVSDETEQDKLLESWSELEEKVGRQTLESACLLWSQIELEKPCKKFGEVDLMEEWLRVYVQRGKVNGQISKDGCSFFNELKEKTLQLDEYKNGCTLTWEVLQGSNVQPPSLLFLRDAAQISTCKELDLATVGLLNKWYQSEKPEGKLARQNDLRKLEQIALWMMLCKPRKSFRLQRCIDIAHVPNLRSDPSYSPTVDPLLLTNEERTSLKEALDQTFFKQRNLPKVAKIILERLNGYELLKSSQAKGIVPVEKTLELEHILPQKWNKEPEWFKTWNVEDAEEWLHRLGNLALLNKKSNAQNSNGPWSKKQGRLYESPYPLTKRTAKYETWDSKAIEDHHKALLDITHDVWELQ